LLVGKLSTLERKGKLIKDISASGLQTLLNQLISLVIFYFTSRYLSKDDFGHLNWATALGATIIGIGSLGLDLIVVKRIAASQNTLIAAGVHLFHTLFGGLAMLLIIAILSFIFPQINLYQHLFLFVFINLVVANIANSFKLFINGHESYHQLAIVSITSNLLKLAGIVFLFFLDQFSLTQILMVYMFASFCELILARKYANKHFTENIKPLLDLKEYQYLVKESLPQFAVVLFDSALARIDWILLGIIGTALATAEYSFAYKIFELSRLPILIVAPILLTRFSKIFNQSHQLHDKQVNEINLFLKFGLFICLLMPIALVVAWSPLIDGFTNNKYGAVNEINFMILAACIPLHFLINFLWTLGFVQSQTKQIMWITIATSVINILMNVILIPFYASLGAALSFFISTSIQLLLYLKFINFKQIHLSGTGVFLLICFAIISICLSKMISVHYLLQGIIAIVLYITLCLLTRQTKYKAIIAVLKGSD